MTFSAPPESLVTIEGRYWLRSLESKYMENPEDGKSYLYVFCDFDNKDKGLAVPYCSPSLTVVQGEVNTQFYESKEVLQTKKPESTGWSDFKTSFRTQANSSYFTLYLQQEWSNPLSSSYFADLKIRLNGSESETLVANALEVEKPLKVDRKLEGWKVSNSKLTWGVSHAGRDNVVRLSDDGEW